MKISLLQQDIIWGNCKGNCERAEELIANLPNSDLYVLPEMFSTGFATEPAGIAENLSGGSCGSLAWMKKMAHQMDAAFAGSIAVKEYDKYYNRFYFVKPDGEVSQYDKHHLFTYGKENIRYTCGRERKVVEWRGVKFLLQVCYDLRFPVFSRNHMAADGTVDYDVALYVASWPTSRLAVWQTLTKARAIENQCFVVAVNRVGTDPACEYSGGTMMINAYGKVVAECELNKECGVTCEVDMDKLTAFRKKFPVLEDAD